MTDDARAPEGPPTAVGLLWLFVRWLPSVVLVTFLTAWSLVMMGGLVRVFGWIMIMSVTPPLGLFVALAVGVYAAIRRRVSRPMVIAWVLAVFVIWPGLWGFGILAFPYPANAEDSRAQTIRVPSHETMRVYWGGNTLDDNYHALYPDQRFAFDLVVEPAGMKSEPLEAYGCFGRPILAPIDGEVVIAHDGEPDRAPGVIAQAEPAAGNHVVLKLSTGTYLFLAHFKKDSIGVEVGQQVRAGDPLAQCGNSGRTSEPHLHLHHQVQDPRVHPFGFAEGLPLFFHQHDGPRVPRGGVDVDGERITLRGDRIRHVETSTASIE